MSGRDYKSELIEFIEQCLAPLNLTVVELEILNQREKKLTVFIDNRVNAASVPSASAPVITVTVDQCADASRLLDEPLDQSPVLKDLFKGAPYNLEISSPGLARPLRKESDYERYQGALARLFVYRPLSKEELEHQEYGLKNPKQKNFLGTLHGVRQGKILLSVPFAPQPATVAIPISLIAKANLEPNISFSEGKHT